jgi:tripartite-type tricarboxylate transporter receptor subunit TctC
MTSLFEGVRRGMAAVLILGIAGLALEAGPALAGSIYPDKPIRMVVPFVPGGLSDGTARVIAKALTQKLGQNVIVENRPGAAGLIGAQLVVRAQPDGYTILLGYIGLTAVDPWMNATMPYDTLTDLTGIGKIGDYPSLIVASPTLRVKTWKELAAYAKTQPNGLFFGTAGIGSTESLVGVMLAQRTGVKLVHVPYQGAGPAMTDVIAGHIPLAITSMTGGIPFVKSGKLIGIAVSGAVRSKSAPQVPTLVESGVPDFVVNSWVGLLAPGKTPPDIIQTLNTALNEELAVPEVRKALFNLGVDAAPQTTAAFDALIKRDYTRFKPVVEAAGLRGKTK